MDSDGKDFTHDEAMDCGTLMRRVMVKILLMMRPTLMALRR